MILVTGGAGFIGSNFILEWIKSESDQVVNLDNLTYKGSDQNRAALRSPRHVFVEGSICDGKLLESVFRKYRPRAVINFAAESHVDRSINDPKIFLETNVIGTFELLQAARTYLGALDQETSKKFRFLHVSTDEVFGSLGCDDRPFTESSKYEPNNAYSASKASSDHLVRAWHKTFGLPTVITNCSNNYGPRQFPEKFIPQIITNALQGKSIPIYGNGYQVRDWLYVSDHCAAIRSVLSNGIVGETYNIGGECEKRNIDVAKEVCRILDKLVPQSSGGSYAKLIEHVEDRIGHDKRYAIDCNKIHRDLGWTPDETFSTGIRKTINWYINNLSAEAKERIDSSRRKIEV